jgi:hypothetical protein
VQHRHLGRDMNIASGARLMHWAHLGRTSFTGEAKSNTTIA